MEFKIKKEIFIAVFGPSQSGKTSFGNGLLGWNEERDEEFNQSLDLFEVIQNNGYQQKYGHILG